MTIAAQAIVPVDLYSEVREEFEALINSVRTAAAGSHVTLGKTITDGVRRIGGKAYQARLDELFERERESTRRWQRPAGSEIRARQRYLETEFGRMIVSRHGVGVRGQQTRFPLDEELALPAEVYAHTLREEVALNAVEASYDRTVARLDRTMLGHVPKRQAEQEVERAAVDFNAYYEQRAHEGPANDLLTAQALEVMSVDGKGVTMRPEGLREATRKEAEAAKENAVRGDPMAARKLRKADKRMAVVTANWEQEPYVRTAGEIVARLGRDPKGRGRTPRPEKAPLPKNKRIAASVVQSTTEGVESMFAEAQRRNPDGKRRNVVLVDGAKHQIEAVEAEANKRGMHITIVLDLIHVIHYLWVIAMLLSADEKKAAEAWIAHTLLQLLTKHPLDVVCAIRQTATLRGLSRHDRKALEKAVAYLRKNATRIHYARFIRDGLPIATGVIEGACRHLIQDRLGITGARWGLAGAEALLKLRAIHLSGDWDDYWRLHLARERERLYPVSAATV